MSALKDAFFRYNSRPNSEPFSLSHYFMASLDRAIENADIAFNADQQITHIVNRLKEYKSEHNIEEVILGVSGGIDSAVVAALFKEADWNVIGVTLPIDQNPDETERGIEVCTSLGIEHVSTDLTDVYFDTAMAMLSLDPDIMVADAPAAKIPAKIRLGNIKARLRMITLYNLASMHNGLVASTDNFSELAAGFWTLHGDVGDVAPIQSLTKSWEVPVIAEALSLPESVVYATPTDGLGIDTGDEAQFGYTYAQADLFVLDLINNTASPFDMNKDDQRVVSAIKERLKNSAFKRANPSNIGHPITGHKRYNRLEYLDKTLTL